VREREREADRQTESKRELNNPHQNRTSGKVSQLAARNWRRSLSRRREEKNTDNTTDRAQSTKKIMWMKKSANP
jgi:hypothetical protein